MKIARDPEQVREALKERDLTLREMGLLARTSDAMISRVLRGERTNPQLARRIARVLRRGIDELFVDAPSSQAATIDKPKLIA